MAKGDGLKGLIRDHMPKEWEIILKRHRVYGLYVDCVYEHNIHKSRRHQIWWKENAIRLKRSLNGMFLFCINLDKISTDKYPKSFWRQLDAEINELINNFK